MNDERKKLWFAYGTMALSILVGGWVIFGVIYTAVTGNGLFTNIRYNTAGRIEAAIFGLAAVAYTIHTLRRMKRMKDRNANDID